MKAVTLVVLVVTLLASACVISRLPPDEALRRSKCSACHPPPEPGQHDRAALRRALDEHQRRVPLTAEQRSRLLRHLSSE